MPNQTPQRKDYARVAREGTVLGSEGRQLQSGVWESGVYLGADGFVYHLTAEQKGGHLQVKIAGKRSVGEYLRWVDGLFRPGEVPGASNAVHYRAARKLRELI